MPIQVRLARLGREVAGECLGVACQASESLLQDYSWAKVF